MVKTVASTGICFGEVNPEIDKVIEETLKEPVTLAVLGLACVVHVPVNATEVHVRPWTEKDEAKLTMA